MKVRWLIIIYTEKLIYIKYNLYFLSKYIFQSSACVSTLLKLFDHNHLGKICKIACFFAEHLVLSLLKVLVIILEKNSDPFFSNPLMKSKFIVFTLFVSFRDRDSHSKKTSKFYQLWIQNSSFVITVHYFLDLAFTHFTFVRFTGMWVLYS